MSAIDETVKRLLESLSERFKDAIKVVKFEPKKILKLSVDKGSILDVASYLKVEWSFDHVKAVTGVDLTRLAGDERREEMEVIYHLGSLSYDGLRSLTLSLATSVEIGNSVLPSLTSIWRSAEFHEREVYEMLGVRFDGHPDLRRLLLPEFWSDMPPLRKDYEPPGR